MSMRSPKTSAPIASRMVTLSGAVRAEESEHLASRDLEVDPANDVPVTVRFAQIPNFAAPTIARSVQRRFAAALSRTPRSRSSRLRRLP
jgi:hypothetical protein